MSVLMVVALAPLARFAARAQQQRPADVARLMPLPLHPRGASLRELPVGLPPGLTVRTPADLAALAEQVLGKTRGRALVTLLNSASFKAAGSAEWHGLNPVYPYRYRVLERILAGVPASRWGTTNATALGAALIELASRAGKQGQGDARYLDAAASAFAVLDRARAGGGCAPQLDLLFLDASEVVPDDAIVRSEAARAVTDCPGDPTPRWVLGQYLSQTEHWPGGTASQAAETVFSGLERDYPGSVAAITGAADAHLRTGIWLADSKPFTARNDFRAAEQGYERAAALGAAQEAAPGAATALIGLGEPARAAKMLRRLIASSRRPGPLLELLVVAEEKAHDFAAA
ncbi:MAG TPA: hypothetical protein VEH31_17315 [Streptosporangiaceae bacterium]|nr:hypothetical protein [Streptosporangiaceae bacterium]